MSAIETADQLQQKQRSEKNYPTIVIQINLLENSEISWKTDDKWMSN